MADTLTAPPTGFELDSPSPPDGFELDSEPENSIKPPSGFELDEGPVESDLSQVRSDARPAATPVSTTAGSLGRNAIIGSPDFWKGMGGPTPSLSRVLEPLIERKPEESLLNISPNRVMTGTEMSEATGIPKAITVPVSGITKAVAGLGQFLTSPSGAVQMGAAAIPGLGLIQRAKFVVDMASGAGQTAGNLSALVEKGVRDPNSFTDEDWQKVSEDTANTLLALYGSGKLSSHEFQNITGIRAPLGRVLESEKTRLSKDLAGQLKANLDKPLTTREPNAPNERQQPQGSIGERAPVDERGKAAETGGGNRLEQSGQVPEAQKLAEASGFDYDPGMEAMLPDRWHFTDRRPGSPTESLSVTVPKGASTEDIGAAIDKAKAGFEPPVKAIPIPLGLNRPEIQKPELKLLTDAEFDKEHSAAKSGVNEAEKAFDAGEPTPEQRQAIADAQDRYSAAQLERFRRNHVDVSTPDIFDKMVDLADKGVDFTRFKLLANILKERGGAKATEVMDVIKSLPESITGKADFREALSGKLDKFKQWLERAQKESSTETEGTPVPETANEQLISPSAPLSEVRGIKPEVISTAQPVTPPVTESQPELVGMGGAVPSEFAKGQGNPTAMKYKLIDQERQHRGLEPLAKGETVSDQTVMDKAMAEIDRDPSLPDKMVAELNSKPRSIEAWERMVLLLRKIDLRDAYEKSARAAAQAFDDSAKFPDRKDDMLRHNIETARLSEELDKLEKASRISGSEQGRGLRSLQIMANEDYSLAGLEMQRRGAKNGAQLTDKERSDLIKVADEYAKANRELEQHLADKDKRLAEMHVKAALDAIALAERKHPLIHPKIIAVAEKIVAGLDRRADTARQRIKERGFRFNVGIDPTVLADVAEIGASHLAHGIFDFAKWSEKMIADFGEGIGSHLKTIFEASNKIIDDLNVSTKVKQAIKRKTTAQEQKTVLTDKIKERLDSGKLDEITPLVQKLARHFVGEGIREREALIDAVYDALKSIKPDITRRETMDAISGYGDFKQLSKDEISVKLRGLKGEMQQVSKLQDMEAGIPPSKTGVERRTPTDKERELIKAVNEAKIKFQVPITDPLTQLKSALDTKKITLENQIKDMESKLANKDFSKRPRRQLVLDRRAMELTAQKEGVVKRFKTEQRKVELQQRTKTEKAFDFISNARRFAVLSGLNVLGKLAAYSVTRVGTMGATEAIGGVLSKLPKIREIATKAPSEGQSNFKALIKSVAKGMTQGIMDAAKTAKSGSSDLKTAFSTRIESGREWYNFFQTLHEVIKSPLRRTAFEFSLEKRLAQAAKGGADVTDPLVQLSISKDAYLDSDRALLLENNRVANGIRGLIKQFEAKNKATGETPISGKAAAVAARVEFPILTVPLNYVKQTLVGAFGLASGSAKLMGAFRRGIDNLKPEESDAIMRHLKYGTLGGAMLLYGFYDGYHNGSNGTFGGYYQPGEKRKPTQAGVGGVRVGEQNISGLFLHNPIMAVGQLGHTIGAVMASLKSKKDPTQRGLPVGLAAGAMGLLNESPIGRTIELADLLRDPRSAEWAMGEHAKGLTVPQIVNEAAQFWDKDENGNIIKRDPKTIVEHIETGIPGLRQTISKKK